MRDEWTDKRLDDLKDGMHREFDQLHREIKQVRTELRAELRDEIGGLRAETNARFESLDRKLYFGWGSLIVTLVGAVFAKGIF